MKGFKKFGQNGLCKVEPKNGLASGDVSAIKRGQVLYKSRLETSQAATKRGMYKAVMVDPKLHWKCCSIGDAKNVENVLRKVIGSQFSQSGERQSAKHSATGGRATQGTHITPPCTLDAGHRVLGFSVSSVKIIPALLWPFLSILPVFPFGMRMFILSHYLLEECTFDYGFTEPRS